MLGTACGRRRGSKAVFSRGIIDDDAERAIAADHQVEQILVLVCNEPSASITFIDLIDLAR
jgi:hypothetical protein